MPFTFSHPALVLPLSYLPRKWVSLTGLVVGSVVPDFEYFLRIKMQSDYSHTTGGLFYFDLPLALILAFIFHLVVRNSLFDNLPTFLRCRLAVYKQFNWVHYFKRNWLTVLICILIGALSHLFWDSFTHKGGYFLNRIASLQGTVELFGYQIPAIKIAQHASSLLGFIVILWVTLKLPKDKTIKGKFNVKYWGVFTCLVLAVVGVKFLCGLDISTYGSVVVTGISAVLIALIITPVINKFFFQSQQQ